MSENLAKSDLEEDLKLVTRGKVRDLYEVDDKTLLVVATDRISAFDVVMDTSIQQKGVVLTVLSTFWFDYLAQQLPTLRTHFLTLNLPEQLPKAKQAVYERRCMQVRKLKVFPIEAIVRGYCAGSAWQEYKQHGTVHGIQLPPGIQESQGFPGGPLYTPSTKAPAGEHDENIHPDKVVEMIGPEHATRIASLAVTIYEIAHAYALDKGIIIADTKFEFGLDEETDEIVLVDEVLTPDSSRYWNTANYEVGRPQESYDKQYLRDWLNKEGLKGKEGVALPEEVVYKTWLKYKEVCDRITGREL